MTRTPSGRGGGAVDEGVEIAVRARGHLQMRAALLRTGGLDIEQGATETGPSPVSVPLTTVGGVANQLFR